MDFVVHSHKTEDYKPNIWINSFKEAASSVGRDGTRSQQIHGALIPNSGDSMTTTSLNL